MNNYMLGPKLQELLDQKKMSIADLSRETDIAMSTLHGWISGVEASSVIKLKRVSDFFGVSLDYLCFGDSGLDIELKTLLSTNITIPSDMNPGEYQLLICKRQQG